MSFFPSTSRLALGALALVALLPGCRDHRDDQIQLPGNLVIEIDHRAGDEGLEYDQPYTIASGETIDISLFKYYLGNFVFVRADGSEYVVPHEDAYFLI